MWAAKRENLHESSWNFIEPLTEHAKHFPGRRHAHEILVADKISDAAEDEAENKSEEVRQARQDSGFGQVELQNFAHEFRSRGQ